MGIIRTDTDYALRALLELAIATDGALSCKALTEKCHIPRSFAYKILKKMVKLGIVESHTGRSGGFKLRKDPRKITLWEVTEAIQGPLVVRQCVLGPDSCPNRGKCPLSAEWRRLQENIVGFLKRTTLEDALRTGKRARPRTHRA